MAKKHDRIIDKMMPDAKKIFELYNFKITAKPKDGGTLEKYTYEKFLEVYTDYNAFENMILVRPYVQKKFKIDCNLLEVLLYLAPKHYFTVTDLGSLTKQFNMRSIRHFVESGYVSVYQIGKNRGDSIYTISGKGWKVVKLFYKLMSGEEKMADTKKTASHLDVENIAWDRKRLKLIKELNQLPPDESKKKMYE